MITRGFDDFDVPTIERCELCTELATKSKELPNRRSHSLDIQQHYLCPWSEVPSLDVRTLFEAREILDHHLNPSLNVSIALSTVLGSGQ